MQPALTSIPTQAAYNAEQLPDIGKPVPNLAYGWQALLLSPFLPPALSPSCLSS